MIRFRTSLAIESLWLIGLVLVALAFRGREWVAFYSEPKFVVLHFVALAILVLWAVEIAWIARTRASGVGRPIIDRVSDWLTGHPHRWTVVAVGGLAFIYVISTILSPSPWVSVWGRDFGDRGYDLYTTLSYLVIFAVIAFRLRRQDQIERLVLVVIGVAAVASLYGIVQHFGWDPVGRGAGLSRVISTFGNPLFFGAYLVMTVPLTLALGLHRSGRGNRTALAITTALLALQMASLWFAGGRGPWIGAFVALIIFVALTWKILGRSTFMWAFGSVLVATVLAIGVINTPGGNTDPGRGLSSTGDIFEQSINSIRFIFEGDPNPLEPDLEAGASPDDQPTKFELAAAIDEFGPINVKSTALSGRAEIWRAALALVASRERQPPEPTVKTVLRHLFGFGPDMFFYSYPLTSSPQDDLRTVSHAHNFGLHVLMEQGLAGLALLLGAAAFVTWAVWRVLRNIAGDGRDTWIALITIGGFSALTGRAVDQITGVGRISDLMLFWAVMGLLVALAEIHRLGRASTESGSATRRRTARRTTGRARANTPSYPVVQITGAVLVAIVAIVIFVQKDFKPLLGGIEAANAFEHKANGDADSAFRSFERAVELAPDVERYRLEVANILVKTAIQNSDPDVVVRLLRAARTPLLEFEEHDPYAYQTLIELASIAALLRSNGDGMMTPEVVGRYRNLSALIPTFGPIQSTAAEQIVLAGDYSLGLTVSERAIELEASTRAYPRAWWSRGESAFQLGLNEEATLAFNTSIKRNPNSPYAAASHRGLAFIAEVAGNQELAAEHHALADALGN